MIQAEGLTKRYGDRVAVEDLNLHVPQGAIYGFLGPNGAGKTTTIRMLLGILPPDAGTVRIGGRLVRHTRRDLPAQRLIGAVAENQNLYDDMSVGEYLRFFAALYRVDKRRVGVVLDEVGLADRQSDFAVDLSRGLQQKLGLARALLHDPPVLILDEPVSGLDPHGIREVREILVRERDRGRCILLSSHVLSEVERTADRVAIIRKGRLVAVDSPADISARLASGARIEIELAPYDDGLVAAVRQLPFVHSVELDERGRLTVRMEQGGDARQALSRALSDGGGVIISMHERHATLEEAFVTMTDAAVEPL